VNVRLTLTSSTPPGLIVLFRVVLAYTLPVATSVTYSAVTFAGTLPTFLTYTVTLHTSSVLFKYAASIAIELDGPAPSDVLLPIHPVAKAYMSSPVDIAMI